MISPDLVAILRCPDCGGVFDQAGGCAPARRCGGCGRTIETGGDVLDLTPRVRDAEQTKYLDEALHAGGRDEVVGPPLLSAALRHDMLRRFLAPGPGDRLIDLGCGNGKVLVWNRECGAWLVGIDVSPHFAREARERVDLTLGDLRRLPFADGAFNKACALDVLEHLSRESLARVLAEAARVLEPGGRLFVYSHVRKNAPIAAGLRLINRIARRLERAGLLDLHHERLRKSDHRNPLADVADLRAVMAQAGFRIERIRYYTPLVGAIIENILVRAGERMVAAVRGSSGGRSTRPDARSGSDSRRAVKERLTRGGGLYLVLRTLTWIMKLDLVLFGRIESGPFFGLLVKEP